MRRAGSAGHGSGEWILPQPFLLRLTVAGGDIDAFGHVNNAVYVTWLDRAAWAHSAALGVTIEDCIKLGRGMVVGRTVIHYSRSALNGDDLEVATWLAPGHRRTTIARRFQIRRASDRASLLRAEIEYTCIDLQSGHAARWPVLFRQAYVPASETTVADSMFLIDA